jgi:hypothetical protein
MSNEEIQDNSSKNVGLKMLLKMGYKPGEGLGVRGQGIKEPIKVEMLPKNAGLGSESAKGKIKENKKLPKEERTSSAEEEEGETIIEHKMDVEPKEKFHYHETKINDIARLKVLKRVEELQISLLNLIDNSKAAALNKKRAQNTLVKNDLMSRLKEVKTKNEEFETILLEKKAILQVIKETGKRLVLPFRIDIKEKYRDLVECIDDTRVSLSIIFPILKKNLQETNSTTSDLDYLKDQMTWLKDTFPTGPYSILIRQTWIPRFRRELNNLDSLRFWGPVLTDDLLDSLRPTISHLIVIPSEFKNWEEALTKSNELSQIFTAIPADPETYSTLRLAYKRLPFDQISLRELLRIWMPVMPSEEYKNLQDRLISPPILDLLKQVIVDPIEQNIDPILAAFEWKEYLNLPLLYVESQLTLKLKRCLYHWLYNLADFPLSTAASGYTEIADWYEAWQKILYPEDSNSDEILDREFIDLLLIAQHFIDHRDGFLSKVLSFDDLYEKIHPSEMHK